MYFHALQLTVRPRGTVSRYSARPMAACEDSWVANALETMPSASRVSASTRTCTPCSLQLRSSPRTNILHECQERRRFATGGCLVFCSMLIANRSRNDRLPRGVNRHCPAYRYTGIGSPQPSRFFGKRGARKTPGAKQYTTEHLLLAAAALVCYVLTVGSI